MISHIRRNLFVLLLIISPVFIAASDVQASCGNIIYNYGDGDEVEPITNCEAPFGTPQPNSGLAAYFGDTEIVAGITYPFVGVGADLYTSGTAPDANDVQVELYYHEGENYRYVSNDNHFTFAAAGTYTLVVREEQLILVRNYIQKLREFFIPTAHAAVGDLTLITFEVVEPVTQSAPNLQYAPGYLYKDDPVINGKGLYPNQGTALQDTLTFAVVYQQTNGIAPENVSLVTDNTIDFNTEFYTQHLSVTDGNARFIEGVTTDYLGFPDGRYLGYDAGLLDNKGFTVGETLIIGVPGSTTEVTTEFLLAILGGTTKTIDLKLRALDQNQRELAASEIDTTLETSLSLPYDTATLKVSSPEPISYIEISVPDSNNAEAYVSGVKITRTLPLASTDSDFVAGAKFTTAASFPKGEYTYYFTASSSDGQLAELKDNLSFTTGYSSVAFVPGIKGSRLFLDDGNQLWEPNRDADVTKLFLTENGNSVYPGIYANQGPDGVIDEGFGLPFSPNVYKSFLSSLENWKTADVIANYTVLPYDWRFSMDSIVEGGETIDDRVYYSNGRIVDTPFILEELSRLASTSDSGKITLVTHSTGGLVMKTLLYNLEHFSYMLPYSKYPNLLNQIDTLVLVASPQLGTPTAIAAVLHGYDQEIDIPFLGWPNLATEETARLLSQNMPSAYALLPSEDYTLRVADKDAAGNTLDYTELVTFDQSVTNIQNDPLFDPASFLDNYGNNITSYTKLSEFMSGDEGRGKPAGTDLIHPLISSSALLQQAKILHDKIDSWDNDIDDDGTPDIRVVQIAGWGIPKTVKGLEYVADTISVPCQPPFTGSCLGYKLDIQPIFTFDGDETVVVPSAVSMGEVSDSAQNLETYYVDLYEYNDNSFIGRKHSSILEVDSARTLIQNIIQTVTDPSAGLSYIKQDQAELQLDPADENKYIRLSMHSPVDVHIYDSEGNHVGISASSTSEVSLADEQIRNSYYLEFGDGKYLGVPLAAGDSYTVEFVGTGEGTFTFEMTEVLGDKELAAKTWSNVPVSATTKATFTLTSVAATNELPLDQNGDGTADQIVHFDIPVEDEPDEQLTIEEQLALLRSSIEGLNLKHGLAKVLLKNLDKAESYYQQKQYPRAILRLVLMEKTVKTLEKIKLIPTTDAAPILESLNTLQTELRDLIPPPRPKDRR